MWNVYGWCIVLGWFRLKDVVFLKEELFVFEVKVEFMLEDIECKWELFVELGCLEVK